MDVANSGLEEAVSRLTIQISENTPSGARSAITRSSLWGGLEVEWQTGAQCYLT